jgi:hypothetical protein
MKYKRQLVITLVFLLGAIPILQAENQGALHVSIPFKFFFGGKPFEPGEYVVSNPASAPKFISLQAVKGRSGHQVAIITRLDATHEGSKAQRLIFDNVGGDKHLSEVWIPGKDGFLILGTPQEHSHNVVTASLKESK